MRRMPTKLALTRAQALQYCVPVLLRPEFRVRVADHMSYSGGHSHHLHRRVDLLVCL